MLADATSWTWDGWMTVDVPQDWDLDSQRTASFA
jgi:hypothetical protein